MLRAMIKAGESFENPRTGTRMEFREWTPERVVIDRTYPPDSGRADPHVHFDFSQSWEVLAGKARYFIVSEEREAGAGEQIEVEPGTRHQDVHNPFEAELRARLTVEPTNEFIEAFADCYTHYLTRDKLDRQDEFKPLQLFPILQATKAQSWIASIPIPLQKLLIPVGALSGRLRGYRARYN